MIGFQCLGSGDFPGELPKDALAQVFGRPLACSPLDGLANGHGVVRLAVEGILLKVLACATAGRHDYGTTAESRFKAHQPRRFIPAWADMNERAAIPISQLGG